MKGVYRVRELANLANVTSSYIRAEIVRGNLKARKWGPMWVIDRIDAEEWLNKRRGKT